jgi:hypothetical protein
VHRSLDLPFAQQWVDGSTHIMSCDDSLDVATVGIENHKLSGIPKGRMNNRVFETFA